MRVFVASRFISSCGHQRSDTYTYPPFPDSRSPLLSQMCLDSCESSMYTPSGHHPRSAGFFLPRTWDKATRWSMSTVPRGGLQKCFIPSLLHGSRLLAICFSFFLGSGAPCLDVKIPGGGGCWSPVVAVAARTTITYFHRAVRVNHTYICRTETPNLYIHSACPPPPEKSLCTTPACPPQSVDMWSVGVIIYVLLAGKLPFYDRDQNRLFRAIKSGNYNFDDEFWQEVSDDAKVSEEAHFLFFFSRASPPPGCVRVLFAHAKNRECAGKSRVGSEARLACSSRKDQLGYSLS